MLGTDNLLSRPGIKTSTILWERQGGKVWDEKYRDIKDLRCDKNRQVCCSKSYKYITPLNLLSHWMIHLNKNVSKQ